MSHLGMLLDLEDGSRLTDVALHPVEEDHPDLAPTGEGGAQGTVYLHVLTPPTTHDPASLANAVAAFLPARLATISGYRPDGRAWIATAQLSPYAIEELNAGPAADAGLRRALGLTGTRAGRFKGVALPARMLAAAYDGVGDVEEWSVSELFVGLLVELTNADLADIVGHVNAGSLQDEDRSQLLGELLGEWSAWEARGDS